MMLDSSKFEFDALNKTAFKLKLNTDLRILRKWHLYDLLESCLLHFEILFLVVNFFINKLEKLSKKFK